MRIVINNSVLSLIIIIVFISCGSADTNNIAPANKVFKEKYQNGDKVSVSIIGDSTTVGFGANGSTNKWDNNLSYGCVNLPQFGANWDSSSEFYLNTNGYPTLSQQDNIMIPTAIRLLKTEVESKNPMSSVYNFGIAGATAQTHLQADTISQLPKDTDIVFVNLGINSAKNNISQYTDLKELVRQILSKNIEVVLVIPNNIGVSDNPSGVWKAESCPNNWYPMDNWIDTRNEIKI